MQHVCQFFWKFQPWHDFATHFSHSRTDMCCLKNISSTPMTLLVFVGHFLTLVIGGLFRYMLNDKALLVNRFISVPRDLGDVNCGAHLGWQKNKHHGFEHRSWKSNFICTKVQFQFPPPFFSSSSLVIHNNRDGLPSSPFRQLVAAKGSNFKASSWLQEFFQGSAQNPLKIWRFSEKVILYQPSIVHEGLRDPWNMIGKLNFHVFMIKRLPPKELILQFFSMHVHHDVIVLAGFTIELLRCSPSQYAIVASHGLGLGFRTKNPSWWILFSRWGCTPSYT